MAEKTVGASLDSDQDIAIPRLRPRADRRDVAAREDLVRRIVGEFHEIPGLCLTVMQGCRLFGLSEDACQRIFSDLVEDGVVQSVGDCYGMWRNEFLGRGFAPASRYHG